MFRPITLEQDFFLTCSFHRIVPGIILLDSKVFPEKIMKKFSLKCKKAIEKWHLICRNFEGDLRDEGTEISKNHSNAEHTMFFRLFENPNGFWFGPSVLEVWEFYNTYQIWHFCHFSRNLGEPEFSRACCFARMCLLLCFVILKCFQRKLMWKFSVKCEKPPKIWFFTTFSHFPKPQDFSWENRRVRFLPLWVWTLMQKIKKILGAVFEKNHKPTN